MHALQNNLIDALPCNAVIVDQHQNSHVYTSSGLTVLEKIDLLFRDPHSIGGTFDDLARPLESFRHNLVGRNEVGEDELLQKVRWHNGATQEIRRKLRCSDHYMTDRRTHSRSVSESTGFVGWHVHCLDAAWALTLTQVRYSADRCHHATSKPEEKSQASRRRQRQLHDLRNYT